jgi:hypothetical protein
MKSYRTLIAAVCMLTLKTDSGWAICTDDIWRKMEKGF